MMLSQQNAELAWAFACRLLTQLGIVEGSDADGLLPAFPVVLSSCRVPVNVVSTPLP